MNQKEEKKTGNGDSNIITLSGMYKEYFLDYASYVILERAIPAVNDGLKPVQRRILYSLKEKDDGRFHKVANIIGHTMQYHPHGDAAIGAALVKLGQMGLIIDTQGNWGDVRTGDNAAAPRYIETRLSKFALAVAFNHKTTEWQLSYDGRNKEPIHLPMKFPLLLAQGTEGIAVGLSTKILPHNFIELIKASIKILRDKPFTIYPDFLTGGLIDVSDYNHGKRGGKVKVRARIEVADKKTILIKELPYGVTTTNLIDSILKAKDSGKIKIKKIVDNTAQHVEIKLDLPPGVSPDRTIDALYAFTNCEISVSPNAAVIIDNKPHFLSVRDILKTNTANTKELLKLELLIKSDELSEKWHFASLEKIFIENRVYHEIEECESWECVTETIATELKKYVATPEDKPTKTDKRLRLKRDITQDDIVRLTEIKIKRISKYNSFKADELIEKLEEEIREVNHHLEHLTEFAIAYFENLLEKFGKGKERRTEITSFETIKAQQVVANNAKLYVNRTEGFVGYGLKKDEFVTDCSDIDDVIVFRKDGKFVVTRIAEKTFVGKNIIHVGIWKKNDTRTTYNMVYFDGKSGKSFAKRFNVKAITRDREYDLTKGEKGSKTLFFSHNPNGESEIVTVTLSPKSRARKKVFSFDFGDLAIKGRGSQGNTLTPYPVKKIISQEKGKSTLGAIKIWIDEISGRINREQRGTFVGEFDTGDTVLVIYKDGSYELANLDINKKFDMKEVLLVKKNTPETIISAIHYEGSKGWSMVKRFVIETSTIGQRFKFISDHKKSKLLFATTNTNPTVSYSMRVKSQKIEETLNLAEFIDVKGWKALGNKLNEHFLMSVKEINTDNEPEPEKPEPQPKKTKKLKKIPVTSPTPKEVQGDLFGNEEPVVKEKSKKPETAKPTKKKKKTTKKPPENKQKLKPGDTIEFDL